MFAYLLGNGETKADTLLINMKCGLQLSEEFKQMLIVFLRYTYSSVYDLNNKEAPAYGFLNSSIPWIHYGSKITVIIVKFLVGVWYVIDEICEIITSLLFLLFWALGLFFSEGHDRKLRIQIILLLFRLEIRIRAVFMLNFCYNTDRTSISELDCVVY